MGGVSEPFGSAYNLKVLLAFTVELFIVIEDMLLVSAEVKLYSFHKENTSGLLEALKAACKLGTVTC